MLTTLPHNADKTSEFVVNNLEQSSSILFRWLTNSYIKVKTRKSHLVSGNVRATANIDNNYIESEKGQLLLGLTVQSNLTLENHINICKIASQILNA